MEKEKKQLGVAFIVVLVAIVMVSAIGIIAMSNKPVVLQGQIKTDSGNTCYTHKYRIFQ